MEVINRVIVCKVLLLNALLLNWNLDYQHYLIGYKIENLAAVEPEYALP